MVWDATYITQNRRCGFSHPIIDTVRVRPVTLMPEAMGTLLDAADPRLWGHILTGTRGSGKSTLMCLAGAVAHQVGLPVIYVPDEPEHPR